MNHPHESTEYRGPDVPPRLGEKLQVALGLDERPEVVGDWVDAVVRLADRDGVDVDLDALCTTDDSPHRATFGGRTQHYQCPLDALIVPSLAPDVATVEVETTSPVGGEVVRLTATAEDVDVEPTDAVVSVGVAADVTAPPDDAASPILAYERFCPYGHAFASRDEYEEWAAGVDAVTMALSVPDALELASAFGAAAP